MKIKSIVKTSVAAIACALITVGCSDAASSATSASNKTKLAISIPSADHGWTGGVVFWANKAKAELEVALSAEKTLPNSGVSFSVMLISSGRLISPDINPF